MVETKNKNYIKIIIQIIIKTTKERAGPQKHELGGHCMYLVVKEGGQLF